MPRHVFLSFVEEDLDLVRLFRGQAKNENSALTFDDYSVKVPYTSEDAAYIRGKIKAKIQACSVLVCLVGEHTHKSEWVNWEIRTASDLGKEIVGVRLNKLRDDLLPEALSAVRAKVCPWEVAKIVALIA
jgi:hypothetical protein